MGTGYLLVQTRTGSDALPVGNAHITVIDSGGRPVFETFSDANGNTDRLSLPTADKRLTLDPEYKNQPYSTWDVIVKREGFLTVHIHDVQIFDTETAILPVAMKPMADERNAAREDHIHIPPPGLMLPGERRQMGSIANPRVQNRVIIPDYITVHLGTPTNSAAANVRVRFSDYIKNVTSGEIYATWPQNSLIANIHVIVTFALNRVYTEWYRSRGFNFDITSSTAYDQYFRNGGPIYENISRIVDEIFNVYAHRVGMRNPFFTSFCNGTTATCNGLSQWGTVSLANQGLSPLQILHRFYPSDLVLTATNNITGITESYPGYPLQRGSRGEPVRRIQDQLNRIRVNFPLIPVISNPDGIFGTNTENAVRVFQSTFNLTPDGIVGRATWNKISFIFVGVTRLAELDSEGQRISIGQNPPNVVLSTGSRGAHVLELQFILNSIAPFYPTIPPVIQDSVFGPTVKNSVTEFQKTFNLTPDGIVGPGTWNKLYAVYRGIHENAPVPPVTPPSNSHPPFPGTSLRIGSTGANVRLIQTYLNTIGIVYPDIPALTVDGVFGQDTHAAVVAFQRRFNLTADGIIGPITWNYIVQQFNLVTGGSSVSLEYPGTSLSLGSTGSSVRLMQGFLLELRSAYPSLPLLTVDGNFGPITRSAVIEFQRLNGLTQDGVIGPITWNAIVRRRNEFVSGQRG